MQIEVKVPALPESVADATVATWHKAVGERVVRDEPLVDLETDKVVLEVPAPQDGVLTEIFQEAGATVLAETVLAVLHPEEAKASVAEPAAPQSRAAAPAAPAVSEASTPTAPADLSPSVRRLVHESAIDPSDINGTGKHGRLTKGDVEHHLHQGGLDAARPEQRVPMTRLRARIAERLVQSQHEAAILTTFNEVNLQAVVDLRKRYRDEFEKQHGVRLGFMSFFVKAATEALKKFPAVNASIDGQDIVYHGYYDIGIAVSTERGLVVPVLRDVQDMSMADIERGINDYAARARESKLSLEEMTGGTFTITNGGVFGSLLATPIINPPQSGILGMHTIQQRPVAEDGQVVIRPMMYIALSYDHRLIDGRESVSFLVEIKKLLEDPTRLLIGI